MLFGAGEKKHAPQKHTSDCLHEHKKTGVEDPTKKKSPGTLRNHEQLLSWLPTGGGSTWWAERSSSRPGCCVRRSPPPKPRIHQHLIRLVQCALPVPVIVFLRPCALWWSGGSNIYHSCIVFCVHIVSRMWRRGRRENTRPSYSCGCV